MRHIHPLKLKELFMKKKMLFYLVVSTIFLSSFAFSQGEYLSRGTNGFVMNAGFSSNDDATSVGASAGYSMKGIFDFGFSFSNVSFDQKFYDSEEEPQDVSATAISPYITVHAIKQDSQNFPLSVALSAAYEIDSYSSNALDDLGLDLSANAWIFGGSLYSDFKMTPSFILQPYGGISYITIKSKFEDDAGNSIEDDESTTAFRFGASFIFKRSEKTTFVLTPGVSVTKDNTTIGLTASLVLPTGGSK
jgi:hypothetical protein